MSLFSWAWANLCDISSRAWKKKSYITSKANSLKSIELPSVSLSLRIITLGKQPHPYCKELSYWDWNKLPFFCHPRDPINSQHWLTSSMSKPSWKWIFQFSAKLLCGTDLFPILCSNCRFVYKMFNWCFCLLFIAFLKIF